MQLVKKIIYSAIYMACENNNILLVELLMLNGANPNIIPNDGREQSTMHFASYNGNLLMFKILLNVENKYKYSFNWVCLYFIYFRIRFFCKVCCELFDCQTWERKQAIIVECETVLMWDVFIANILCKYHVNLKHENFMV